MGPISTAFAKDTLLPVADAARRLGVRTKTVKDWIESGKLPASRNGATMLISRQALLEHLERLGNPLPSFSMSDRRDREHAEAERKFILQGFPDSLKQRLQTLIERQEDGHS